MIYCYPLSLAPLFLVTSLIDGLGWENESNPHNYHLTFELSSTFTYSDGEFFSHTGDNDLWLFIDDQLLVDSGGVHSAITGDIDLDTLGLTIGNDYSLDLFFAERHTKQSNFRIDTSIRLEPTSEPEPTNLILMSLGLIGIGFAARKKHA